MIRLLLAQAEPITRDDAREDARRELADAIYRQGQPTLVERAARRAVNWFLEQLDSVVRFVPGGLGGLAVLLLVIVALVVLALLGRSARRRGNPLYDRSPGAASRTAAEYRALAERLAAAGSWREAVRERFRALIRELEERGVLDPRPGRTSGEVVAEAGAAVPPIRPDLRGAADVFDEIWYGERTATRAHYERMAAADDVVRRSRLVATL